MTALLDGTFVREPKSPKGPAVSEMKTKSSPAQ